MWIVTCCIGTYCRFVAVTTTSDIAEQIVARDIERDGCTDESMYNISWVRVDKRCPYDIADAVRIAPYAD